MLAILITIGALFPGVIAMHYYLLAAIYKDALNEPKPHKPVNESGTHHEQAFDPN
jgi:hypothetical protein